ncbi:hypothetical protein BDR22DRAFT_887138 [Usnea florida]
MGSYNYAAVKTMQFFVFFIFARVVLCSGSTLFSFNDSIPVQPDVTTNGSALGVPSDFDIEYSMTYDYGPPMNEIAVYMTVVTALEDLCFRDQSATIPGYPHVPSRSPAIWSLPRYNLAAGSLRARGLWPVIARYFWRGNFAGRLDFANKDHPLPPMEESSPVGGNWSNASYDEGGNSIVLEEPTDRFINTTTAIDIVDGARLTIKPVFRGVPLGSRTVFGAAVDVMVLGAEYGLDTYCLMLQRVGVQIVGLKDADGEPLLKYKSVIRAMSILTTWMVFMNRFGEVDVDILRDRTLIGRLRIQARRSSTATSLDRLV